MGKQYLTPDKVKLIKHLHHHHGVTPYFINKRYGFTSRPNLIKILNNERWMEVNIPEYHEGELLYWKWINNQI